MINRVVYGTYKTFLVCIEALWARIAWKVDIVYIDGYVDPFELCWYDLLGIETYLVESE